MYNFQTNYKSILDMYTALLFVLPIFTSKNRCKRVKYEDNILQQVPVSPLLQQDTVNSREIIVKRVFHVFYKLYCNSKLFAFLPVYV